VRRGGPGLPAPLADPRGKRPLPPRCAAYRGSRGVSGRPCPSGPVSRGKGGGSPTWAGGELGTGRSALPAVIGGDLFPTGLPKGPFQPTGPRWRSGLRGSSPQGCAGQQALRGAANRLDVRQPLSTKPSNGRFVCWEGETRRNSV